MVRARRASHRLLRQRQQGQDPALALIVGAHDQQHVFDRDDQDQRPHDQRQHAQHILRRERQPVLRVEALAEGVDRARPDIAEDDAERGERKPGDTGRNLRPGLVCVGARGRVAGRNDLGR